MIDALTILGILAIAAFCGDSFGVAAAATPTMPARRAARNETAPAHRRRHRGDHSGCADYLRRRSFGSRIDRGIVGRERCHEIRHRLDR